MTLKKKTFEKIVRKKEQRWYPTFSFFSPFFLSQSKHIGIFTVKFILSSRNTFNLGKFIIECSLSCAGHVLQRLDLSYLTHPLIRGNGITC